MAEEFILSRGSYCILEWEVIHYTDGQNNIFLKKVWLFFVVVFKKK